MKHNIRFHGIFCDDIRQEIGNKVTLVGCYGDELYVPDFPAHIHKLCVHFILTSIDERSDQDLDVSVMTFINSDKGPQVRFKIKSGTDMNGGFEIHNLNVKEENTIVLKAVIDGKEYFGGRVIIKKPPKDPQEDTN